MHLLVGTHVIKKYFHILENTKSLEKKGLRPDHYSSFILNSYYMACFFLTLSESVLIFINDENF